jgi:DNA-binding transcriptional MerR regulator
MYTPAEEIGLSGKRLAERVQNAIDSIPHDEMIELIKSIRREAKARHLVYQRDGVDEIISLLPSPITLRPDQLGYTHYVSQTLLNCIKRLPDLYFSSPEVHELLRISPPEEEWLRECWTPAHREANPVFSRFDVAVDYSRAAWKDSIKFMEPNLTGIGGLHISPTSMEVLADLVVPAMMIQDPTIRLQLAEDIRELLLQDLMEHLDAIARPEGQIVLVDPKYSIDGPDEMQALMDYYKERYGITVLHADVTELKLRGDEVYYGDARVDLIYRDASVQDLIELASEGVDVAPMRALLKQNRVVSSIAAELDQKSCFEVFTDPLLADRFLTEAEQLVMRRHVLWTRILSDRRSSAPDGKQVDLLEFARKNRETLVLKPNRSYGGEGVIVGPGVDQGAWESGIEQALKDQNDRWVLQETAEIPVKSFHLLDDPGELRVVPFNVVMGIAPSNYGVAMLVRASPGRVVNIAQGGGTCAVMVSAKALHTAAYRVPRA